MELRNVPKSNSSGKTREDLTNTQVQCTISSKSIKYKLNGTNVTQQHYKEYLRANLGFETPCFFIQQSKATSLAAADPVGLLKYLQETTGEQLVNKLEANWKKTRQTVQLKYVGIIERVNKLAATRTESLDFVHSLDKQRELSNQLKATEQSLQNVAAKITAAQVCSTSCLFKKHIWMTQQLLMEYNGSRYTSSKEPLKPTKLNC